MWLRSSSSYKNEDPLSSAPARLRLLSWPQGWGGKKIFLFSSLFGEMIHFTNIFQMGWNHQLVKYSVNCWSEKVGLEGLAYCLHCKNRHKVRREKRRSEEDLTLGQPELGFLAPQVTLTQPMANLWTFRDYCKKLVGKMKVACLFPGPLAE